MHRTILFLTLALVLAGSATAETATYQLDLDGPAFSLTVQPQTPMEFILVNTKPARDSYSVKIEDKVQGPFPLNLLGTTTGEEGARQTTPIQGSYKLKKCQKLTIHVERKADGDDPKKEWDFVFETGGCGRWLTHYGFSFLPSKDEKFFTRALEADANGEGGGFQIVAENDRGENDFEPTVTFTFVHTRNVPLYFSAGLGADVEERLVFAGASYLIGDNVNIFVGAAGHQQSRLKGKYDEDQVLKEDLDAGQLTDETFDFNVIFGVGFRFDGNPFKKKSGS